MPAAKKKATRVEVKRIFLFDYDNTLYSPDCGLVDEVVRRMILFLQERLNLSPARAQEEANRYRDQYGTVTTGIFKEHPDLDLDEFSRFIHNFAVPNYLAADQQLQAVLAKQAVPLYILSNGWEEYVEEGLRLMGVRKAFRAVYGIRHAQFVGKPNLSAYERVIDDIGVEPNQVVYFDDNRRDLAAAKELGMTTVWVHPDARDESPACADHRLENIYQLDSLAAVLK